MLKHKKILCIFIAALLLFTLSACGKSKTGTESENTGTVTTNTSTDSSSNSGEGVKDVLSRFRSIDNYTYSATSSVDGVETMKFKTWVKGNRMRFETATNGITTAIYYNLDEKIMYSYDSESKTAVKMEFPGEDTVKASDLQYNFHKTDFTGASKTGTEKVAGKDCSVYEYTFANHKTKIWVWEEHGILLKVVSYDDDKLTAETVFDTYEIGKVTDEMVTLPKDAKIMELGQ